MGTAQRVEPSCRLTFFTLVSEKNRHIVVFATLSSHTAGQTDHYKGSHFFFDVTQIQQQQNQ